MEQEKNICLDCIYKKVTGIRHNKTTGKTYTLNTCRKLGVNLNNAQPYKECAAFSQKDKKICFDCLHLGKHNFTGENVCIKHGHTINFGISECISFSKIK